MSSDETKTQTNKYNNSKIYTIRCRDDNNLIYVGSTTQPLYKRFYEHKKIYNNENNKEYNRLLYVKMRELGGEIFYIELYENLKCDSKEQLLKREGQIIRELGTLNKKIEGRTPQETEEFYKDYNKQYKNNNKEQIKEQTKQYRINNKEKLKQHYNDNKEQLLENHKEYFNKPEIKERMKEYYNKPEIKEKQKQYYNNPEIKEKQKQYYKEYNKLKKLNKADQQQPEEPITTE
jgi:hypothetical protein